MTLVGIAYAAVSQGAFYSKQLRVTVIIVFAGLLLSVIGLRPSRREVDGPVIAAAALAAWYLIAGLHAHDAAGAFPAIALLGALAATVVIVRRADSRERELMLVGLLGVGVMLALSGWTGVAWRQSPRALEDGGLWRAASTITYSNATGGMMAALSLVALGFTVDRRYRFLTLVPYILVVGLFATASRAGVIGFVVGLSVLTVRTRGRVLVQSLGIFAGTLVAFAALVPSMPVSHQPHPVLAFVGLAVGAAMSLAPTRVTAAVAVGVTIVLITTPGLRQSVTEAVTSLREERLTANSPDRSHELHQALTVALDHMIVGVGPGHVDLTWNVAAPTPLTMHVRYVHDEYLQVFDEAGAVGALILVAGLATVGAALRRAHRESQVFAEAGCTSALVAFAVHSSMDFLWHVPLIPLTGAVLVGALLPPAGAQPNLGVGTEGAA